MPRFKPFTIIFVSLAILSTETVFGVTINITGDSNDRPIFLDNGQIGSNGTDNVVMGSLDGREVGSMWVFQLPTLATGATITAADLRLTVASTPASTAKYDMNLYAVTTRSSAGVIVDDYTGGTLLQTDFITDASSLSAGNLLTTNTTAAAGLATFLNDAYANGTAGGDYVFLRLHADWFGTIPASGSSFLRISSSENATESVRPLLLLTMVPEPSSLLLLLTGITGLFVWQRYR